MTPESIAMPMAHVVDELDSSKIVPFPALDATRFRDPLDEEMGYI